jgi:hypothetical protein
MICVIQNQRINAEVIHDPVDISRVKRGRKRERRFGLV